MSQNIERLKELLFDNEVAALENVSNRISYLAAREFEARQELSARLEDLANQDQQAITEIQTRITALASASQQAHDEMIQLVEGASARETAARTALTQRLDALHERTGDDERLTASVTQVISESLRRAEVLQHAEPRFHAAQGITEQDFANLLHPFVSQFPAGRGADFI